MVKYYCDRCGKEVQRLNGWKEMYFKDTNGETIYVGNNGARSLFVCLDCFDDIVKTIIEKPKRKTEK